MALTAKTWNSLILILLTALCIISQQLIKSIDGKTYYVIESTSSPCPVEEVHECETLASYLRNQDLYFNYSKITLKFMPGYHMLQGNEYVLAGNFTESISLLGIQKSDKLKSSIVFNGNGQLSIADNIVELTIQSLSFISHGYGDGAFLLVDMVLHFVQLMNIQLNKISLTITMIDNFTIENVFIYDGDTSKYSMVDIVNSSGLITNLVCANNYGVSMVHIIQSRVDFNGLITFTSNVAHAKERNELVSPMTLTESDVYFSSESEVVFKQNLCSQQGGALKIVDNSTAIFAGTLLIADNLAFSFGGGIQILDSMLVLEGYVTISHNSGSVFGGAIDSASSTIIMNGTINIHHNRANAGPYASFGGAIKLDDGVLIISGSVNFSNNVAGGFGSGGALHIENSTITVFHATVSFTDNFAAAQGGGLYIDGNFSPRSIIIFNGTSTVFRNNTADTVGGGAIHAIGQFNLSFYGNTSFLEGTSNIGSAYLATYFCYDSSVIFSGQTLFMNGYARSYSIMYTHGYSLFLAFIGNTSFINNTAADTMISLHRHASVIFQGNNTFKGNRATKVFTMEYFKSIHLSKPMLFSGNTSFIENIGRTLYVISGVCLVHGSVTFSQNSKTDTAALTLVESTLTVNGTLRFENNDGKPVINSILSRLHIYGELICLNHHGLDGDQGVMTLVVSDVIFHGQLTFMHNVAATTIFIWNTNLTIQGHVIFQNNSAQYGGALSLELDSKLIFEKDTNISFLDNKADIGGCIYVQDLLTYVDCNPEWGEINVYRSLLRSDCFFNTDLPRSVSITARGNMATSGGTILYGGKIDQCKDIHALEKFKKLFQKEREVFATPHAITSEPYKVCHCKVNTAKCRLDQDITPNRSVIRGEEFSVHLAALDQLNQTIKAIVRAETSSSRTRLGQFQSRQQSTNSCTEFKYQIFSFDESVTLTLYVDGPCNKLGDSATKVSINLLPCPDAFQLAGDDCTCETRLLKYTSRCFAADRTIENSGDFWVGGLFDNDTYIGLILYPHCPFDYCKTTSVKFTLEEADKQCNFNRSGTLCGQCGHNRSLLFGTLHCSVCSNNYIAFILIFALAGIALVALLLLLKLTVAHGTINGLIFYANIVAVNKDIFFPPGRFNWLKVFIAWINLDVGIEMCFFDGMDMYAHTWLQFIFPFYVWFLVGMIIIMSHHSTWITRQLGSNPVAVLATLFLLSYAKLLRTIITAFYFAELEYPNSERVTVWLYDGNIVYLRGKHIPLFIFALFVFLIIFIPYNLLLVLDQYLHRQAGQMYDSETKTAINKKLFGWYEYYRIHSFVEAYTAPYNTQYRHWTGLLLLIRCILFLVFAFNALGNPSTNLLMISSFTLCLVVLTRLLQGRIYKSWWVDALEASFLLNLGLFSIATYHVTLAGGNQQALAYTSVGIAFAKFIGIVLYHIIFQIKSTECYEWLSVKIKGLTTRHRFFNRNADDLHEPLMNFAGIQNEPITLPTTSVISIP